MVSEIKFDRKIKVSFNDEKSIEKLRMRFRVERVIGDSYSNLKLEIYNLILKKEGESESIFKEGDKVLVEAGYHRNISTLFTGSIRNIQVVKEGVDTITTVFASDLNTASEPVVNVSYRQQTSLVSLLSDIAFEADISIAEISVKENNLKGSVSYSKKFSLIMDSLADTYNFYWYIFNFDLYIYDNDSANSNKEILKIDASTGLLETPVLTQKGIDIKMLLEPSVRPNDRYIVSSVGLVFSQGRLETSQAVIQGRGLQSALSVIHTGDTHNNTWFTEIEGIRVNG